MGCGSSRERAYPTHMVPQYSSGYIQEAPIVYSQPMPEMQQPMPIVGNGHLASDAFLNDWTRFLHGQTPPQFDQTVRVDQSVFPVHEAGRDWAEQTLQRIHQDLEGMGIGGDYNYDQNGDDRSGEILVECKTSNHGGPNQERLMRWKLIYEIASAGTPQALPPQVIQPQLIQPQLIQPQLIQPQYVY